MYRNFWQLYVKEYGRFRMAVLICGISICVSLFEALNIGLLLPLLDTLNSAGSDERHWVTKAIANLFDYAGIPFELGPILLVMVGFFLVSASFKLARALVVARGREDFRVWIKTRTMWSHLRSDLSYFHQRQQGTLADTLGVQADTASQSLVIVTEILSNITVAGAYLITALVVAPLLTTIAFAMVALVMLSMQHHVAVARAIGIRKQQRDSEFMVGALENLNGIRVIKAFLLERRRWKDFEQRADSVGEVAYRMNRNSGEMIVAQEAAMFTLVAGIVYIGVTVLSFEVTVIVAILFMLGRMTPRLLAVNSMRRELAGSAGAIDRIKIGLEETAAATKVVSGNRPFTGLKNGISLDNVSFSYDGDTEVLRKANLTIESGKMTSVVGSSGAGKSTIVDLLLRFYDPNGGAILVDETDLRDLDLESWRRSIGVVSQDIFLFNDTIANNISMAMPEASMDDIIDAAKQAYAHEFITQLPDGYESIVGDRGWNLSGGQQQRITLARAIIKKPSILILDEATSSLDSESEGLILDYIEKIRGTCTILVIAHRMSTIKGADKIIVLQDGVITEEGDWNTLMAQDGIFARYQRLQSGQNGAPSHELMPLPATLSQPETE